MIRSKFKLLPLTIFALALGVSTSTYAESSILKISCPESADSKTTIVCTLSGHTDTNIESISANLTLTGLTYESAEPSEGFEISVSDGKLIINSSLLSKGSFEAGKISLKVTTKEEKATAEIKDVEFKIDSFDSSTAIGSSSSTKINQVPGNETTLDLLDLKISGYEIKFYPEVKSYKLTIKDETSLDIKATPASDEAKVEIKGNENLADGSVITISVSNDSETRSYKITITKEAPAAPIKKDSPNYILYICIGAGLVAIIILIIVLAKKSKSKTQKPTRPTVIQPIQTAQPPQPRAAFELNPSQNPSQMPIKQPISQPVQTPTPNKTIPNAQDQLNITRPMSSNTPLPQPTSDTGISVKDLPFNADSDNPAIFQS